MTAVKGRIGLAMCSALFEDLESLRYVKVLSIFRGLEVYQRWEQQDHISTLIHDWSPAVRAADLARQLVDAGLLGALIPAKIVVTVGEVNVLFVEDGCPLKWCT